MSQTDRKLLQLMQCYGPSYRPKKALLYLMCEQKNKGHVQHLHTITINKCPHTA